MNNDGQLYKEINNLRNMFCYLVLCLKVFNLISYLLSYFVGQGLFHLLNG